MSTTAQATALRSPSATTTSSASPAPVPEAAATPQRPPHEHAWHRASSHATSQGWIAYARCAGCTAWRVERLGAIPGSAEALSRGVPRRS